MKRVYLTIAVVLLIAFVPVLTVAQTEATQSKCGQGHKGVYKTPKGGSSGGVGMVLRLKEKLDLSTEQVEKLKAIKDEAQGQFKATTETVKTKKKALHDVVQSGASESAIRDAADLLGKALGDRAVLKASTKAKVNTILTDTQKSKLGELKKEHTERRKEHHGFRGARDPESAFARIDTNGDGAISREEFKAHMEQMKERRSSKRSKPKKPIEDD